MPGHALHLAIASEFLGALPAERAERWRKDPVTVRALYQGALAPDVGYFPGGDRLITDLAHYVAPMKLARSLVDLASTQEEQAFAWGWVTHVVADSEVHRPINRASGETLNGSASDPATWADSPSTHTRVEMGLDAVWLAGDERLADIRMGPEIAEPGVAMMKRAFLRLYEVELDEIGLRKSLRRMSRVQRVLFPIGRAEGRGFLGLRSETRDLAWRSLVAPLRWLSGVGSKDSTLYAITHPLAPAGWFESEVREIVEGLPNRFNLTLEDGLFGLEEVNLDTGEPESASHPYPPAVQARADLAKRRSA